MRWIAVGIMGLLFFLCLAPAGARAQLMSMQAQGHFLAEGQSGFHPALSLRSADYSTAIGIGAGYKTQSAVEFGAEVYRTSSDLSDVSVLGIGPFIGYYAYRQTEEIPVSVRLSGSYIYASTSGDGFGADASSSTFEFAVSGFHQADVTESMRIAPYLEVGLLVARAQVGGPFGSDGETVTDAAFEVGMGIGFRTGDDRFITVTPSLGDQGGGTWFGISVGYLVPSDTN